MDLTPRELLDSPDFRRLMFRRWRISLVLTACLFVLYYGYILLVATNKEFLSRTIDGSTTVGMPIGAGVIIGSWVLTAIYVAWANRHYDAEVARLRARLKE